MKINILNCFYQYILLSYTLINVTLHCDTDLVNVVRLTGTPFAMSSSCISLHSFTPSVSNSLNKSIYIYILTLIINVYFTRRNDLFTVCIIIDKFHILIKIFFVFHVLGFYDIFKGTLLFLLFVTYRLTQFRKINSQTSKRNRQLNFDFPKQLDNMHFNMQLFLQNQLH